jgi:hypothetical protein
LLLCLILFIDLSHYIGLGICCLTPLSTIFQLYRGLLVKETGVHRESHRPVASHRETLSYNILSWGMRDHRGHDRMVVEFTTTCAITDYHHYSCEFESR